MEHVYDMAATRSCDFRGRRFTGVIRCRRVRLFSFPDRDCWRRLSFPDSQLIEQSLPVLG